jgi:predicted GIY-YIG superfamily endonuclease
MNSIIHNWDEEHRITCSLKIKWKPLGKVELDEGNRLVFPVVDKIPALYRFRIREDGKESLYVGETMNVRRRFSNYKSGAKSQKTSHRINRALVTALQKNAEVSVSLITEGAFIDKGCGDEPLDLSSKVVRCYLENGAILCGSATNIKNLNKANV